jgi:transitional endoplasmic reticulum ATPase
MSIGMAVGERPWLDSLRNEYQCGSSNVFLLHGNTTDYVEHPADNVRLTDFLAEAVGRSATVVTYSPDQGIQFPGLNPIPREARERFEAVVYPEMAMSPEARRDAERNAASRGETLDEGIPLPRDPAGAIEALLRFVSLASAKDEIAAGRKGRQAAVIIERMDLIAPPSDKSTLSPADRGMLAALHRIGSSAAIGERGNLVILLAPSLQEVHADLRQTSASIQAIEIEPPSYEQRLAFSKRILERREVTLDDIGVQEFAAATAGLSRRSIEDIVLRGVGNGKVLTRKLVRERKANLLAAEYAEVLTVLEPDVTMSMVGGHELAKRYLLEDVIPTLTDEEQIEDAPMGILFTGPSGTGKTFLARALGTESGLNFLQLDADKIRDQFVGGSEQKLAKALKGVVAMAPCIVFIDELDQKVKRVTNSSGGGGDSVESNIFGKLLEFFSDTSHRGRILLAAASNRPDQIDAALKRPGRIDASIPLLPPDSAEERAEALSALMTRFGMDVPSREFLVNEVGTRTDLWTQAELEGLVVKARGIARRRKLGLEDGFSQALTRMRRNTDDVDLHTRLAIAACDDASLVPARYQAAVGRQVSAPPPRAAASAPAAPVERGVDVPDLFGGAE